MILAWKTKTTPMRELKRRKLADIVGREKEGRVTKSGVMFEEGRELERSSTGIICWSSLFRSVLSQAKEVSTHFSNNRSCMLDPVSEAAPRAFCMFSLIFFPCFFKISRFLSIPAGDSSTSSERSADGSNDMTGIGSSRLTKASTVNSSMSAGRKMDWGRGMRRCSLPAVNAQKDRRSSVERDLLLCARSK